jgi:hypothetical protein
MLFGDENEADPSGLLASVPASDATAGARPDLVTPPVFHPLAYRAVVAEWPLDYREKWGRRANSLEESGLTWRDAETQAFIEVWKLVRHQHAAASTETALVPADVERN